ncbi:LuxR C-terminal-related transcriptional regulator [Massilia sp. CT11-137]|uniref:LuxR C-terminal-related transcriptional regulator n=1 Tax=Massilia sp. CT11-137 TaxID=3393901 RepID=UPI0039B082AE
MDPVVILSRQEQEYLLCAIESGLRVAGPHQFFLWTQGQVQALLPHRVLVCLQFGHGGVLTRVDCLHGTVLAPGVRQALTDLALRIARGGRLTVAIDARAAPDGLGDEILRLGFDNVLAHGTGPTSAGGSVFLLFGLAVRPTTRHAYFLELLLPHLHLALGRLPAARTAVDGAPARALSARETEIIGWLRAGKSNDEMGRLLGISALTVKNHLQRIYRTLGVNNRAHALARCMDLRLLGDDQDCGASAAARRMAS